MAAASSPVIYMEEILYKRSRGRRHPSRVNIQKRFCRLTGVSFVYFEKKGDTVPKKGDFPVSRIRIVEKLDWSFKKVKHWFQFGDDEEVIYLGAESEDKQHEWIKALKKAATNSQNKMILHYHPGLYTGGKWSCCKKQTKQCQGCEPVHSAESDADEQHSRQTSHQTRLPSDLSFTSNSSEETITESLGSKRPSQTSTGSLNASWSQQSTTTLTSVSENEMREHEGDDESKEEETTYDKLQSDGVSRLRAESGADSGLGSEFSSRSSSESVGQSKRRSLKQTRSLGLDLEDVAESNDLPKKHQSQPNLHSTSHKSEPGHKESLLHDQVLSKLTSKLQGSTLDSLYEEEEQTDTHTMFQCFTPPTQNVVQALEFYGPDKLISASCGDSYVRIWDVSGFKPVQSVKVSSSVLALAVWSHYLAIGSSVVQAVDMSSDELRRIIFVEDNEGIPSSPLPSHFVAFVGEEGHLATARAESTVVKVWPPPAQDSKIITSPEAHIPLTGQIQGLSATHKSQASLLAVTVEKKENETCCKSVCLIDWKKHEDYKIIANNHNPSVRIHTAFSPDARQVSTGIGKEVAVWETGSGTDLYHFNTDAPVCSVVYSHDGSKLAVGLSTEEVEVFDPTSIHHLFTLRDTVTCTKGLSSATSLAYSGDDKMFATGYQNGRLKLWKVSTEGLGTRDVTVATSHCFKNSLSLVHGMEFYNDLEPLLTRVETLDPQFNENGIYEYQSVDDDFKLIIPEGAIVGDHKVQVAVMKYGPIGPFEYPDGYTPVSPIVWLCSSQKKFHKYLELILPHCSTFRNSDDEASQTQLVFLKASHNEYICNKNGQKVFPFKEVDAQSSFNANDLFGSLYFNHCCFYCVGVYLRKDTDQANLCLIVAKPRVTTTKYTISICLTLDLPTCEKAIQEQFEECDLEKIDSVKFAEDRQNGTLEIKINRQLAAKAGWLITIKSRKKINANDVWGFWDFRSCGDLVKACNNKSYPPRFILEVSAKRAFMDTYLEVLFEGAVDELCTEIQLECPTESLESQPAEYMRIPYYSSGEVALQNPHDDSMESENSNQAPGINGIPENESSEPPGLPPPYKHFNGQWVPPNNPH